jgi:hypothetical protein
LSPLVRPAGIKRPDDLMSRYRAPRALDGDCGVEDDDGNALNGPKVIAAVLLALPSASIEDRICRPRSLSPTLAATERARALARCFPADDAGADSLGAVERIRISRVAPASTSRRREPLIMKANRKENIDGSPDEALPTEWLPVKRQKTPENIAQNFHYRETSK